MDLPIETDKVHALQEAVNRCNDEGRLHIQLILNEPKAFSGLMTRYGLFDGISNYFAMIAPKAEDSEEKLGYYGEKLVLLAQELGLRTCWVGLTYKKQTEQYAIGNHEKLYCVIALGYGKTDGKAHRSKSFEQVAQCEKPAPDWFRNGVEAALLAPTAVNQQKFKFTLKGEQVLATGGKGFYTKVDLGIAKLHFEIGSGKDRSVWAAS